MERVVLCGASVYEKKFYLNEAFYQLPTAIKEELNIMCVLFTEEVGGILTLEFDEDGYLTFQTMAKEDDLLYDEIGSHLKIKQMQRDKQELFESIETFYRVMILGEVGDF